MGWFLSNRNLFLTVLEARKIKIEALEDSASGDVPFIDGVSPHGRRDKAAL
jgi:hypothetical protein